MKTKIALAAALALTIGTAAAQGGGGSPIGVTPNYKPSGGTTSGKPNAKNVVVRAGGQGHNNVSQPKGKVVIARTTPPAHPGKRTTSTNSQPNTN